ncbi:MAG: outer membrane beta-barrel protein [Alphaproteobacteria bacterium]|nr:outer membrane beta-barrel protein [Alphaproteobacteria bacterium]
MSVKVHKLASVALGALALWTGSTGAALAYGPEGMFGGRPNPDDTVVLDNPLDVEVRPLRTQSVLEHPRPDYDPIPVTLGSFDLFPSFETGVSYDSNIYAANTETESDAIFTERPGLSAFSNWGRHALAGIAYGDLNFFADHTKENFNNAVAQVQGRYDVSAQTWLSGRGGYQHLSTPRSSPDDAGGSEPATFNVAKGGLSAYRGAGQLKAKLDYDLRRFDFNEVKTSTATLDQSGRDRTTHELGGKVSYDLTENLKPYVKTGYNWRRYDHTESRSSEGYSAAVGTAADFGGITSLDLYVGWMAQDYDKFTEKKGNDAVDFGGRFEWNITGLTSLVLEAGRSIEETTQTNFNSALETGGSATLTHELMRNLLLEADVSFTRSDYNGLGERQDDMLTVGGGSRWLINRYLYSDFVYNWSDRSSSREASEYQRHLVSVRLGVQM